MKSVLNLFSSVKDPQKYADPRGKISTKNCKKNFSQNLKFELLKKSDSQISWFLYGWSFSIKISEKNKAKKIMRC